MGNRHTDIGLVNLKVSTPCLSSTPTERTKIEPSSFISYHDDVLDLF